MMIPLHSILFVSFYILCPMVKNIFIPLACILLYLLTQTMSTKFKPTTVFYSRKLPFIIRIVHLGASQCRGFNSCHLYHWNPAVKYRKDWYYVGWIYQASEPILFIQCQCRCRWNHDFLFFNYDSNGHAIERNEARIFFTGRKGSSYS